MKKNQRGSLTMTALFTILELFYLEEVRVPLLDNLNQ